MGKFDWKSVVGSVAPALATALGGPLAGMAVKTLATQFLGKDDATEKDVAQAIAAATPQDLIRLKEIDAEFSKAMLTAGVDLERIAAEDRNSARNREIQTHDSWTPRVLAAIVVGGFMWCLYFVLGGHVKDLKDPLIAGLVGTLIGYTSAKADAVISYYFGSSASSKAKDDTISTIAKME